MKIKKITRAEAGVILSILILALAAFFFYNAKKEREIESARKLAKENSEQNALNTLILGDEAYFKALSVYDVTSDRKIYSINDDKILPLASLTKIMTVVVALENDRAGSVVISDEALKEEGFYGLEKNEFWNTEDLAKFALVVSSNDAAKALTEYDDSFIHKMNKKVAELGMSNTVFYNSTGLDLSDKKAGAYGTAEDMNKLSIYAFRNFHPVFRVTSLPQMNFVSKSGFSHKAENTNLAIGHIPNLLFSKTGYTSLAGGNLSVIFLNKQGHEIAVTILGSSKEGRFYSMENIAEVLYNLGDE